MKGLFASLLFIAGAAGQSAPIQVVYPLPGSIFPPDFAPPAFLFRDSSTAQKWQIEAGSLRAESTGELFRVGEIDSRAVAPTNKPPFLTPELEGTRTWVPDAALWNTLKQSSSAKPVTITFTGYSNGKPVSRGAVSISTAKDPVGAPVFFRDVPLMPGEQEKGVIRPLPKPALPLVAWRLRYVGETTSRLMVDNLPTCMNCHSFSRDGKTLGLDLDGPQNDKGLYAMVPVQKESSITNKEVIAWSSFKGKLGGKVRVGFMSQVSPDGKYVVTMVSGNDLGVGGALPKDVAGNFYVANFKDYRFLQVFYPTRGVLAWYSKDTGKLQPLPGADDLDFVHTNVTWSPDGKYLVFARARARTPYDPGKPRAERANDPNETPLQYDLYRIPFNDGKGGTPEPITGASANGKSNSFAKISPDGKWIVFVQANNGLLMRPDSQLFIVPASGGTPRRMNCNTSLMNSWHSFSPNGRWLVFSSKVRGPYTQMYLTHIDENGNDSPAVLIENATAANRAVNIPEFVNIGADEWMKLDVPAADFYRIADNAFELLGEGKFEASMAEWRKALEMDPNDTMALNNLGSVLSEAGELDEAVNQFRKALEIDPENYKAYTNLGITFARAQNFGEAVKSLDKAVSLNPEDGKTRSAYGGVLVSMEKYDEARKQLEKALEIMPEDSDALNNMGGIEARTGQFERAIPYFRKALESEPNSIELHYNLGRALAASGKTPEGIEVLEKALAIATRRNDQQMMGAINQRIAEYRAKQ